LNKESLDQNWKGILMSKKFYFSRADARAKAFSGKKETVDFADRWLEDGLAVCEAPGAVFMDLVDVSALEAWIDHQKKEGKKLTLAAVIVRAAALALARLPELNQIAVGGIYRYYPPHINIGLSQAGETFVAPLMLLEKLEGKRSVEIADEIAMQMPEVRKKDEKMLNALRKWGWIVPVKPLRQVVLRWIMKQLWFRRGAGTLQISYVPGTDVFMPLKFTATAIVGVGDTRDRVIAVDGQPSVRRTVWLYCAMNHSVWDGLCTARFLTEMKKVLETVDPEL
jgi:pyruvate/2-oxoglutarate dehydrogenase complex dihydrolipoamide acyltransferase (E2) component